MESNNDEKKSLFETIGFKYNDNSLIFLDPVDLVRTDESRELKGPEDVIRRFNKHGYLGINDAALFAVYFGVPKDPDEYLKWEKLEHGHVTAFVMNLIMESGITNFTKLFWVYLKFTLQASQNFCEAFLLILINKNSKLILVLIDVVNTIHKTTTTSPRAGE